MASSGPNEAGDIDFKAVLARFRSVNDARLERIRSSLRERQRDFLDLLPLLFHINHPMLPGFSARNTPAGVYAYEPSAQVLRNARTLSRSFQYRSSGKRTRLPIQSIYVMGSPGTVAYSEGSDLDVWLVHDPELRADELELLQQKARNLEVAADKLELEVHFFLVNTERFREGEGEDLSSESSGSAQHNLLLEEFYRTGILLAGRYPFWWLVPPEQEGDYDEQVADMQRRRFIHARDGIDFGGLAHIPAEEFFGAALWQLSKGIDSPYKSALKLLLIEAYAAEYPHIELLCLRYKRAIYAGVTDLDKLDPYLMMLDKVNEHLDKDGRNQERLELARRCFYFKADEPLSQERPRTRQDWRRELLSNVVKSWGWGLTDLILMDTRNEWKVHRVAEERRILFEALSASYRFLSDFARRYAGMAMISQRDLNILGRKLYAAFERKAGKVELLNRGIASDLRESHLSLHELLDEDHSSRWILYRGVIKPSDTKGATPLKRSRSVVELIAWCYFNSVLDKRSALAIYTSGSDLSTSDFRLLVDRLHNLFPERAMEESEMEDFSRPAQLRQSAVFLNMGIHPLDNLELNRGKLSSGSNDALCYGPSARNLVMSLDHVMVNSWHEVISHRYAGARGLMDFICDYLKWAPLDLGVAPPPVRAYGTTSHRGSTVAHRVEELITSIAECYYDPGIAPETRYVFAIGRGFCVLNRDGGKLRYSALSNEAGLIRELGRSRARYSPVVFDRYCLRGSPLPSIYARNKRGIVQLFYLPANGQADIYVLDERGALFHQRIPFDDRDGLLNHYSRFFEASLNRINFLIEEGSSQEYIAGVELYAISRGSPGEFKLQRHAPEFNEPSGYFSLQVLADADENGKTTFTLYCEDQEFSTLEYGRELFDAVVSHILQRRRGQAGYPIYITDISLAPAILGENGAGRVQSVHFLTYKQRIEEQLNKTLQARRKG